MYKVRIGCEKFYRELPNYTLAKPVCNSALPIVTHNVTLGLSFMAYNLLITITGYKEKAWQER